MKILVATHQQLEKSQLQTCNTCATKKISVATHVQLGNLNWKKISKNMNHDAIEQKCWTKIRKNSCTYITLEVQFLGENVRNMMCDKTNNFTIYAMNLRRSKYLSLTLHVTAHQVTKFQSHA